MPWDSGRRSGTLSHGKGRARRAGALRIPPLRSQSLARSIDRDSQFRVVGAAAERFILLSPNGGGGGGGILHAFSLFLSLSHSTSVHGIPQNITRSRHSFFTVDRRREPRDNNGGEERFATAITLRRRERRAFLFSPFPLHSIPFARSLARLEGGRRVGRSGQSLVTFRSRGTDRPRLFLSPVHLASSFTLCVCVCVCVLRFVSLSP